MSPRRHLARPTQPAAPCRRLIQPPHYDRSALLAFEARLECESSAKLLGRSEAQSVRDGSSLPSRVSATLMRARTSDGLSPARLTLAVVATEAHQQRPGIAAQSPRRHLRPRAPQLQAYRIETFEPHPPLRPGATLPERMGFPGFARRHARQQHPAWLWRSARGS